MKKKDSKVLQEINTRLYNKYKSKLTYEKLIAPEYLAEAKRVALDPETNEITRRRTQNILDSGTLEETETTIDEEVKKQFEDEMDKEIDKAIKEKRLSKPDKKFINKIKQYARRQTKKDTGSDKKGSAGGIKGQSSN